MHTRSDDRRYKYDGANAALGEHLDHVSEGLLNGKQDLAFSLKSISRHPYFRQLLSGRVTQAQF